MKPKPFNQKLRLHKQTVAHLRTGKLKNAGSDDDQSTPKRYYCLLLM